jgi:hypothetical protein
MKKRLTLFFIPFNFISLITKVEFSMPELNNSEGRFESLNSVVQALKSVFVNFPKKLRRNPIAGSNVNENSSFSNIMMFVLEQLASNQVVDNDILNQLHLKFESLLDSSAFSHFSSSDGHKHVCSKGALKFLLDFLKDEPQAFFNSLCAWETNVRTCSECHNVSVSERMLDAFMSVTSCDLQRGSQRENT